MVQFQKDVKQESDSENFESRLENQSSLKIRQETTKTTKRTQTSKSTGNCFDDCHISENVKQCMSTNKPFPKCKFVIFHTYSYASSSTSYLFCK